MERTYLALIHKDPDSSFGVTFPDFLGCTSGGDTFQEAREMAREALALQLEGLAADGLSIPPPCSPDDALTHEDAFDAIALIVVEALPERTEEEAQAEFEAFLASDEYQELYGTPIAEGEFDDFPYYDEEPISEAVAAGIGLRPVKADASERIYAALVRQNADGGIGISFPDLPGCTDSGESLEAVCKTARKALTRHLDHLATGNASIPEPSSASDVQALMDGTDAVALTVVTALSKRDSATEEYREIYGDPVSAS